MNLNKFFKKNYKKIIVVCLIMLLFSNKMYENFTSTQALDAVKSTEKKVNDIFYKVDKDWVRTHKNIYSEKEIKAKTIRSTQDVIATRNMTATGNVNAKKDVNAANKVNAKNFCIDGVCINKTHLEMLTGKRHHFISNWKKNRFMKQEGNEHSWKLEFKPDWADSKKRLFIHNINGSIPF